MHWLDSATISDDGLTATATRAIPADHPFVRDGRLLPAALIELMAQAAAAGSTLKAQRQGRTVQRGVLVAVRNFHIIAPVPVGASVELTAVHERTLGALSMVRLEARVNNALIASAHMTFHLDFE